MLEHLCVDLEGKYLNKIVIVIEIGKYKLGKGGGGRKT
jgi:hypothetical protein